MKYFLGPLRIIMLTALVIWGAFYLLVSPGVFAVYVVIRAGIAFIFS